MSWNKQIISETSDWGGPWTEKKLQAFQKYVWSYLTIMKKYPYWKTIYFDGFAGSGSKTTSKDKPLMEQLKIELNEQQVYQGSAERVLNIPDLSFDYYYFIEKDEKKIQKLKNTLQEKVDLQKKKLEFRAGDANRYLNELAAALKTKNLAALVFLDPFGMQINWDTISKLNNTRCDVWILVPTGVIVNRLLDRKGKLKYSSKLQAFFGLSEEEIKKEFYKEEITPTLFGEEETTIKLAKPIEKIAKIYASQMKTIWKFVTEQPLRLDNRSGSPIFHFVFASNKENALKIANHIIRST